MLGEDADTVLRDWLDLDDGAIRALREGDAGIA